jgi:hypothetical protein
MSRVLRFRARLRGRVPVTGTFSFETEQPSGPPARSRFTGDPDLLVLDPADGLTALSPSRVARWRRREICHATRRARASTDCS